MEFRILFVKSLIELLIPVLLTWIASKLILQQKQSRLVNRVSVVIDAIAIILNGRNLLVVLNAIIKYNAWSVLAISFLAIILGIVVVQIKIITQYLKNKKSEREPK